MKSFPSIIKLFLSTCHGFFVSFIFIARFFMGLCESWDFIFNEIILMCALFSPPPPLSPPPSFQTFVGLREPLEQILYLYIYHFPLITHLFLHGFNQICCRNSSMYALPVKQLLAKSKHLNVFKRSFYTVD